MAQYRISTVSGQDYGVYEGKTPTHAMAAMVRDAGYRVTVKGDSLVWDREDDAALVGELRAVEV